MPKMHIRLDQSNIRPTRIELKYVAFNSFRRRILHALNLGKSIRRM